MLHIYLTLRLHGPSRVSLFSCTVFLHGLLIFENPYPWDYKTVPPCQVARSSPGVSYTRAARKPAIQQQTRQDTHFVIDHYMVRDCPTELRTFWQHEYLSGGWLSDTVVSCPTFYLLNP